MEDLKQIIESLLFITEEPLSIDRLKKVLHPVGGDDIRKALSQLTEEHNNRRGGFTLKEVAGGYQFRTRPEYSGWVKKLIAPKPTRLSRAALETLAIIAYNQPIIRSEIEHIRGVDSGGVLRMLLEKNLIRVMGRKEIPGRPLIYGTTRHFLEVFELKNLKDLPTPKEIEEMGEAAAERVIPGTESKPSAMEESISDVLPEFDEPTQAELADDAEPPVGAPKEEDPSSSADANKCDRSHDLPATDASPPTDSEDAASDEEPKDDPDRQRFR